jgi:DNA-binding MarR family transcriptional regulator
MTDDGLPSLSATANHIRRSLGDFARRMRTLREDHGVSASKLSALGRLRRAGHPLSATELARLERLQPQSVTRIIADLEADGLIIRRQNESDRRQLDIAITKAGIEILTRDARRQNEWLARAITEKLTPAERAIVALAADLLERLADSDVPPAQSDTPTLAVDPEP